MTRFGERLNTVIKSALDLRKAIGEEVTSGDFEIVYVSQGKKFNTSMMEDLFGGEAKEGDIALGVVDLGLRLVEKGEDGRQKSVIVVRPKVFLRSAVETLMTSG
jgi:hypothetical protein